MKRLIIIPIVALAILLLASMKTTVSVADRIRSLRKSLDLTQHEFAHLIGTSAVSVARWEEGRSNPQPYVQGKLERLEQLVKMLRDTIAEEDIPSWLTTKHPSLRSYAPCELLDNQFSFEEVTRLVESIQWGSYS